MKRTVAAFASALALGGCVTFGGDPLATSAPLATPKACEVDAQNTTILCSSIQKSVALAEKYRSSAAQLDGAQAGLGGLQLLSALSALGFAAFKAHPDNILAAGLVGGASTTAREGLKPAARRDVLRRASRAAWCVAEEAQVFVGVESHATALQLAADDAALYSLSVAALLSVATRAKYPAETDAVRIQLTDLDAAVFAARAALGPMRFAYVQVDETRRLIEKTTEKQLAAAQPDYGAIAAAIAKLAPTGSSAAEGTKSPARDAPFPTANQPAVDGEGLLLIAGRLKERTQRLKADTYPGPAEFQRIAKCLEEQ